MAEKYYRSLLIVLSMILGQSTNYRISSTVFCIGFVVYYLQVLRLIFDYDSDSNTLLYFGTWIAQVMQ